MTNSKNLLNEKYCDIDGSFGLHDYSMSIDLRNQHKSFFTEIFRKVFTNFEKLDRNFHNSPYKYGSNKLTMKGSGWASFPLIDPDKSKGSGNQGPYWSDTVMSQFRFEGKPFYVFSNLIAQN